MEKKATLKGIEKNENISTNKELPSGLFEKKFIKPLPRDLAKLALYVVCISDLSSVIQASYDLASSVNVSTVFVLFSVICSFFGLLGFYSITTSNKETMKIYTIYTYVRLILEVVASFLMSTLFYLYYKNQMYDNNIPVWIAFFINASCLTISRIAFSYVAYSFLEGIDEKKENVIDKTNIV
ncbi:hypothetical protein FG386_001654 [Cryptosporidium ryanae]|uniref:uncharacterized protein n=1 Tax=Cryptosporidium ryanae TaxID=515981 RepID=UPI00351AA052|nr:hypothetical protein FG386_001654 [Cryptosporidium ryanae]